MKWFTLSVFSIGIFCFSLGCKKTPYANLAGGSSLTVVNAVIGSQNLVTNFTGSDGGKTLSPFIYKNAPSIPYENFSEFGSYSGTTTLSISPVTDTLLTLWSGTFDLSHNQIHSLFLTGTDTLHIDSLFTLDNPPVHADSSAGIRFVNLSPGSNPVSIDIQGQSNGSETTSLGYKGITAFKNYAATAAISSYVFEFRDAATGNLLASYTLTGVNNGTGTDTSPNTVRWKNMTIALTGLPGAQGTFLINNY